jgi:hypothetical protein
MGITYLDYQSLRNEYDLLTPVCMVEPNKICLVIAEIHLVWVMKRYVQQLEPCLTKITQLIFGGAVIINKTGTWCVYGYQRTTF